MNIWNLIGGIFSIIIAILLLIYLIKNPIPKEEDTNKDMLQGYGGAFGLIILGIVLILNELKVLFK